MPAIVVDLGGTHLRCGVWNDDGTVLQRRRAAIPNFLSGLDEGTIWNTIVEAIVDYVRQAERAGETGKALIVAVPGPVVEHARLLCAPTIVGSAGDVPDLRAVLRQRTGRDVRLLNDVSAATWHVSERIEVDRFLVVTVSSGIGSKLFDRRNPERVADAQAFYGEIGHVVVDRSPDAPVCDCGAIGHLGAIASGRGTERLARRLARRDVAAYRNSSCFQWFGAEPQALTNEAHLVPAARRGDPWSLRTIELAALPLAQTIAMTVVGAAIERVVIVGGFAQQLGTAYRDILEAQLASMLGPAKFRFPKTELVTLSAPSDEACLTGAGAFYRRQAATPA